MLIGKIWFKATDKFELNLSVDKTDYTTDLPITISCQSLSSEEISKYKLYYKIGDSDGFKSCDVRSFADNGVTTHQWYIEVYRNDTYHFKFVNEETGEEIYESVKISNIVYNQDNVNNYINGAFKPSPFLSTEYISDTEILITTQKFFEDEFEKLECSYSKYIEDLGTESSYVPVKVRSFEDKVSNKISYQFYFSVSNLENDGDGTYFVRFYNKILKEYTYASISVMFENIVDYQDSIFGVNSDWQKLLDFFKERFGFLIYPFELIVNVLDKMNNVEFKEPKFVIPDINEPVTNQRLISAVDFNFNDILEDGVFKNIHDIYLIVVDAIIIFALINLAKNKIMGVFEK